MSTTNTDTETGWSKEWPIVTGYYWRRINGHDYPSLVRIVGDTCRFTDGSSEGRYECYEFAGPISPSDSEQLTRLREAAEVALKYAEHDVELLTCESHERADWCTDCAFRDEAQELVDKLREALTQRAAGGES